jgi:hypothetical protein
VFNLKPFCFVHAGYVGRRKRARPFGLGRVGRSPRRPVHLIFQLHSADAFAGRAFPLTCSSFVIRRRVCESGIREAEVGCRRGVHLGAIGWVSEEVETRRTFALLQLYLLVQDKHLHSFRQDAIRSHGFYGRLRLYGLPKRI